MAREAPEDRLEGELSRVMIEEYGAVNMNLAEALRQRNELRHKVEQLELEKIVVEAEAEQNRRMAELWESRARQAEKHVELLTDQITVLEQRPQQFHTPQQEEEPQPPRPETPPPPPPGIRSKRQKLEMTPGGTRVPQDPPPYDHEWPNPENGWVMDGVSYKLAWGRSSTRSRSTSKDVGETRKPEEEKPATPVAPLLQQRRCPTRLDGLRICRSWWRKPADLRGGRRCALVPRRPMRSGGKPVAESFRRSAWTCLALSREGWPWSSKRSRRASRRSWWPTGS